MGWSDTCGCLLLPLCIGRSRILNHGACGQTAALAPRYCVAAMTYSLYLTDSTGLGTGDPIVDFTRFNWYAPIDV
jgi:hypothetical protein